MGDNSWEYCQELATFLSSTSLGLTPSLPPTLGDGNCWFRALATQARLASLPSVPWSHAELREAVARHLQQLSSDRKAAIAATLFGGRTRRLSSLAERQMRSGEYVDDDGVMALATADYLGRNIVVYGFQVAGSNRPYSEMWVDGGGVADSLPPLTVFLHREHYQSLQPLAGLGVQDREVREKVTDQPLLSENFPTGLKDGGKETVVKVKYPETAEEMNDTEGFLCESVTSPDTATRTRDCDMLPASASEGPFGLAEGLSSPCQTFSGSEAGVATLQQLMSRRLTCVVVEGTEEEMRMSLKRAREMQTAEDQNREMVVDMDRVVLQKLQKGEFCNTFVKACTEPGKEGSGVNKEYNKGTIAKADIGDCVSSNKWETNPEDNVEDNLMVQNRVTRTNGKRIISCMHKDTGGKDDKKKKNKTFFVNRHPSKLGNEKKTFNDYSKDLLNTHKKERLNSRKSTYTCKYDNCDYRAKLSSGLMYHLQAVHQAWVPPNISCHLCDFKGTKSSVKLHMTSAHKNIMYKCVLCEFQTKMVPSLKRHVKEVHTNPSIICDLCGYRTGRKTSMKQHIEAIHFQLKHYCGKCEFQTSYIQKLKIHKKKVHAQEQEFNSVNNDSKPNGAECPVCSQKVFGRTMMAKHIQAKHPDSQHCIQCDSCGHPFMRKAALLKHQKSTSCLNRRIKKKRVDKYLENMQNKQNGTAGPVKQLKAKKIKEE